MISLERAKELLNYSPETGEFRWRVARQGCAINSIAGSKKKDSGYIQVQLDGRRYYAHRLAYGFITGSWPKRIVDHKNRRTDDNREINLREVTKSGNGQNQTLARKSKSGLLGVSASRTSSTWCARIKINGKQKHLGSFSNPNDAHRAYLLAKKQLHPDGFA